MASQELNQALWGAANVMRSTMSADEYKDYLLGLVFYKYLFSTGIPTCVIILKKDNTDRSVLFIDASKEFRKDKAQNYMDPEHINKIVEAYKNRQVIDKFAHLATFEEIKENDYNLNIPRYVDTSEPEPEIDLDAVTADMENIDADIKNTSSELLEMMKELTFSTPEIEQSMSKLIKTLEV